MSHYTLEIFPFSLLFPPCELRKQERLSPLLGHPASSHGRLCPFILRSALTAKSMQLKALKQGPLCESLDAVVTCPSIHFSVPQASESASPLSWACPLSSRRWRGDLRRENRRRARESGMVRSAAWETVGIRQHRHCWVTPRRACWEGEAILQSVMCRGRSGQESGA